MYFIFQFLEDKDLIFQNGPYFFENGGIYLNKWTLYFDPIEDIYSSILVWLKIPHLPLAYWGDDCLKAMKNSLGKYVDHVVPKDKQFTCA